VLATYNDRVLVANALLLKGVAGPAGAEPNFSE
jgi:hypothetical protein